MARTIASGGAIIALCALAACSSARTEVMPPTVNVSIGQQLIDLKKARDGGALAPKEYEQQVRKLIDSVQ
ncbi:MAG: hypothetical protein OEW34_08205 [Burkholderiaceae bacterium]|jgi:hypothetical protein|nr:hypothetical protein [Burkholderiaceae bacterium]